MEFAKIWPLTCHNWVKYWPRTKNNTTNREYSARAICWSFPRSSTTLRLETPRGGSHQPPPLHRRRWRITVYGRGLIRFPPLTASWMLRIAALWNVWYLYTSWTKPDRYHCMVNVSESENVLSAGREHRRPVQGAHCVEVISPTVHCRPAYL